MTAYAADYEIWQNPDLKSITVIYIALAYCSIMSLVFSGGKQLPKIIAIRALKLVTTLFVLLPFASAFLSMIQTFEKLGDVDGS